jgi:hypothetical protein
MTSCQGPVIRTRGWVLPLLWDGGREGVSLITPNLFLNSDFDNYTLLTIVQILQTTIDFRMSVCYNIHMRFVFLLLILTGCSYQGFTVKPFQMPDKDNAGIRDCGVWVQWETNL